MTNDELIEKARSVANPRKIGRGCTAGDVGCALVTEAGNLYLGVCIDISCGIGFCAEHSTIAAMVTHGEQHIRKIVAVLKDGTVLAPCGRCREFMHQIDSRNLEETEVVLGRDRVVRLRELLPCTWDETMQK
jgi:cytidine deaminase